LYQRSTNFFYFCQIFVKKSLPFLSIFRDTLFSDPIPVIAGETMMISKHKVPDLPRIVVACLACACLCWLGLRYLPTALASTAADHLLYADALANGWEDWSWDSTTAGDATAPVHNGSHAYAVTYDVAWAAFYLRANTAFNTTGYTHLRFWIHGGTNGGQQLQVKFN
jgi:hypothetical protein